MLGAVILNVNLKKIWNCIASFFKGRWQLFSLLKDLALLSYSLLNNIKALKKEAKW